jgi:hypothetical protein
VDETAGACGYKWFSLRRLFVAALHGTKPLSDGRPIAPRVRLLALIVQLGHEAVVGMVLHPTGCWWGE